MFKSTRWRSEKNNIKVVFKLQFQATQVPELRGKALMISLVPADVGKPTVRLEKVAVLEGTCCWENPIYETVKLIREPKTGTFREKIYNFIVSTGSSKAGLLGEVSLDFADYAEATKPLIISQPLNTSNTGAILHVTVQKMQGTDDPRDVEENEAPKVKSLDRSLKNLMGDCSIYENSNLNFAEDEHFNKITTNEAEQNSHFGDHRFDDTIHQDFTNLRRNSMPQKKRVNAIPTEKHVYQRTNTDWSVGSASDGSMVDSSNSPVENFPIGRLPEASNNSDEKLKNEISMLERQVEVSELELQSLRKQIVKESRRGQDLSRRIVSLKEERDALKTECETLKSSHKGIDDVQPETEKLMVLLEEIRQALKHEKELNNSLWLQLQKTEVSNSELILEVNDLDEMLEQKNMEIFHLSSQNAKVAASEACKCKRDEDIDEQALEELINEDDNAKEADLLKQKIKDLYGEIEVYRKGEEELKSQMEQLSLEFDIVKQENDDITSELERYEIEQMKMQNEYSESLATINEFKLQVERLEKEINQQALEFSESLDTINELETRSKSFEKELEKQAQNFEDELGAVMQAKVEQEQRAIQAEEALRKARWSNAQAAERFQDEFRRLSVEMTSKIDENEKLVVRAVAEANDLRLQNRVLEETLQNANQELGSTKDQYEGKLQDLLNQTNLQAKQIEQMSLELDNKHTQIQNFKRREEGNHKAFATEIQTLKDEIERLQTEKNDYSEEEHKEKLRDETEQMKTLIGESEKRWGNERAELEREFASVRKEAEKLQEESITLRTLKDEQETIVGTLRSEMGKLKIQYNELKHCLFEMGLEKENLRKQAFKLEGHLQKKEVTTTSIQKERKHATHADGRQVTLKDDKSAPVPCSAKNAFSLTEKLQLLKEARHAQEVSVNASKHEGRRNTRENTCNPAITTTQGTSEQNEFVTVPVKSETETCSEKELKASTCQISDDSDLTKLLSEVASLKERNKHMGGELIEMQEKYSEISLKFAEVEGERQQLVMTLRNLKNGKKK